MLITIIILLILATITINAVVGDNGLIYQARSSKDMSSNEIAKTEGNMNEVMSEYANLMSEDAEISEPDVDIELTWEYVTVSGTPTANSYSMTWDLTSIPNYQNLELNKTLNPVMVSSFDMANWSTSYSRDWSMEWGYTPETGTLSVKVNSQAGPQVQYGTGLRSRTVGIYYLKNESDVELDLTWNYVTVSGTPTANSYSMTWDLTSIPNYQNLDLNKTLNPVMVSSFDMANWNTSYSRDWSMEWGYTPETGTLSVKVNSQAGPQVQYGTGLRDRTVGIYYLEN